MVSSLLLRSPKDALPIKSGLLIQLELTYCVSGVTYYWGIFQNTYHGESAL